MRAPNLTVAESAGTHRYKGLMPVHQVIRYADDVVTGELCRQWCNRHLEGRDPDEYFFPAFYKGDRKDLK